MSNEVVRAVSEYCGVAKVFSGKSIEFLRDLVGEDVVYG